MFCAEDDGVAQTGSITSSNLLGEPRPASETEVHHPVAAAPLPPTRHAARDQSAWLLIRRIMPVCTCV